MLGNFQNQAVALIVGFQRIQDRRELAFELDVDNGADHLGDASGLICLGWGGHKDVLATKIGFRAPRRRR